MYPSRRSCRFVQPWPHENSKWVREKVLWNFIENNGRKDDRKLGYGIHREEIRDGQAWWSMCGFTWHSITFWSCRIMMSWRMCNTVHAIYTSNHNNNIIIIITNAMQGSKSPSKLALEMNEGITLIQGNTCLKPKIKSNNSAPVEYEKKKA